jgi:molybdopterin synthase catalytic subunit
MAVRVQTEDFDAGAEIAALRASDPRVGAVAAFIGVARDVNDGTRVDSMTLEHYPGMTERALEDICVQARSRWNLIDVLIVHRVGTLKPTDQIVLVVVTSSHRGDAFAACEFVMDYLKTEAPFWKREATAEGSRWVQARESDDVARDRWDSDDLRR